MADNENCGLYCIRIEDTKSLHAKSLTDEIKNGRQVPDGVILVDENTLDIVKSTRKTYSWQLIAEDSFIMLNFSHVSKLCILLQYLQKKLSDLKQILYFDFEFLTAKILVVLQSLEYFLCYEAEFLKKFIVDKLSRINLQIYKNDFAGTKFDPLNATDKEEKVYKYIENIKIQFKENSYHIIKNMYNSLNELNYKKEFCKRVFNITSHSLVLKDKFIKLLELNFGEYLKHNLNEISGIGNLNIVSSSGHIEFSSFIFTSRFDSSLKDLFQNYSYQVSDLSLDDENINDSFWRRILLRCDEFIKDLNDLINHQVDFFESILSKFAAYEFKKFLDMEELLFKLLVTFCKKLCDSTMFVLNRESTDKNSAFIFSAIFTKFFRPHSSLIELFYNKIYSSASEDHRDTINEFCCKLYKDIPEYFKQFKFLLAYYDCEWIVELSKISLSSDDSDCRHLSRVHREDDFVVYADFNLPYIKYYCKFLYQNTSLSAFSDEHNLFILNNKKSMIRIPFLATGLSPQYLSLMIFKFVNYLNYEKK